MIEVLVARFGENYNNSMFIRGGSLCGIFFFLLYGGAFKKPKIVGMESHSCFFATMWFCFFVYLGQGFVHLSLGCPFSLLQPTNRF